MLSLPVAYRTLDYRSKRVMSLESVGYVANARDIEALVTERIKAGNLVGDSRTTYLRALIATAQNNLGITVPNDLRKVKKGKPDPETLGKHIAALDAVHEVFYAAVQKAAKAAPIAEDETRSKTEVIASRITFARSAYSVVRQWLVRGQHGLASIVVSKATKHGLVADTPARMSPSSKARNKKLKKAPIMKAIDRLLGTILFAAKSDREGALQTLQDAISALSRGFDDMGLPANKIREEVEHTATGVFEQAVVTPMRRRKAA